MLTAEKDTRWCSHSLECAVNEETLSKRAHFRFHYSNWISRKGRERENKRSRNIQNPCMSNQCEHFYTFAYVCLESRLCVAEIEWKVATFSSFYLLVAPFVMLLCIAFHCVHSIFHFAEHSPKCNLIWEKLISLFWVGESYTTSFEDCKMNFVRRVQQRARLSLWIQWGNSLPSVEGEAWTFCLFFAYEWSFFACGITTRAVRVLWKSDHFALLFIILGRNSS